MPDADVRRLYIGRPSAVLEVVEEIRFMRSRHVRRARWRFVGLRQQWFRAPNVFRACLDAAHACRMSGQKADWRPVNGAP